jgi:tetratricopeptide (TPR) repeat protein
MMGRFGASRAACVAAFAAIVGVSSPIDARADESWATARAEELCAQGDAHRSAGDVGVAIERYRQAIELDPTLGRAYLSLGGLREATGDAVEAERTYAAGIDHVAGFVDGLSARGELRLRAGRGDDAIADLLAAMALAPTDVARVRDAAISLGKLPLALASSRRLVTLAVAAGDGAAEHEARVTTAALVALIGFVDPVVDGDGRCEARRALARTAAPRLRRTPRPTAKGSADGAGSH